MNADLKRLSKKVAGLSKFSDKRADNLSILIELADSAKKFFEDASKVWRELALQDTLDKKRLQDQIQELSAMVESLEG